MIDAVAHKSWTAPLHLDCVVFCGSDIVVAAYEYVEPESRRVGALYKLDTDLNLMGKCEGLPGVFDIKISGDQVWAACADGSLRCFDVQEMKETGQKGLTQDMLLSVDVEEDVVVHAQMLVLCLSLKGKRRVHGRLMILRSGGSNWRANSATRPRMQAKLPFGTWKRRAVCGGIHGHTLQEFVVLRCLMGIRLSLRVMTGASGCLIKERDDLYGKQNLVVVCGESRRMVTSDYSVLQCMMVFT